MSIFDNIARAFKGSKEPTAAQIRALLAKAEVEVAEASASATAIEARLPTAVMAGEEGVAAHREETRKADEKLAYLKQAQVVLADKLAAAEAAEAEAGRRSRYDAAVAAQRAARAALLESYGTAIATLRTLQRQVADADALAEATNNDLPQGVERLLETESIRDVAAVPERIIGEESVDQWVTESGAPVDAARVIRREGKRGWMYAESSFGPRPVACRLVKMRRVVRQPWSPPAYAARLADAVLPDLMAEPVPPAAPVTEFVPITPPAEAAE